MANDRLVPTPLELQRAQEIMDGWDKVASSVAIEGKDKIGALYIQHILGLGGETAQRFVSKDRSVWNEVGIAQSGIAPSDEESRSFWESVRDIDRRLVDKPDDLSLLVRHGGAVAACDLLWTLELKTGEYGEPQTFSRVLHDLKVNALSYK